MTTRQPSPVASDEIISEENPPAGTVVDNLTRSGFGLYSDGLSIKPNFQEAKKAEIISEKTATSTSSVSSLNIHLLISEADTP